MIFAVTAVILVWSLIAHDLWVLSGSAMSGDDLGGGPGAGIDLPARLLVLLLGMFLSCLVWQAWRQLQQAGHESAAHVALQRLIVDHASEAMMLTDSAQRIVSVNAAFTAIQALSANAVFMRAAPSTVYGRSCRDRCGGGVSRRTQPNAALYTGQVCFSRTR